MKLLFVDDVVVQATLSSLDSKLYESFDPFEVAEFGVELGIVSY
jgi:hypothetical protein